MPQFATDAGHSFDPDTAASSNLLPRLPQHRDPFDRLLVWTAIRQDLHLISRDRMLADYVKQGLCICSTYLPYCSSNALLSALNELHFVAFGGVEEGDD